MKVRTTTLKNNMVVLTDNIPHLESASLGIWAKSGSRFEEENEHGISHLLEHMAFKGTKNRSARQIAEQIENVGGELNAATSIEHTGYFARILKEDSPLAAEILSDILQNSIFDAQELKREQQVIVQEIGASHDDPDEQVFDNFLLTAYPNQSIGRPILGTVESVCNFTPNAIRSYMQKNYVGDRMIVTAAGNIDHFKLVEIIEKYFSKIAPDGAKKPQMAKYIGGDKRIISKHEQVHILLGIEGRAYNADGYYACQILAKILGGGMSSRLFQNLREKRGLCYSIYAFSWSFADSGILAISSATGPEQISELVPLIIDELKYATQNISEEEVIRVRNQIRASLLMSLESPTARSAQLARQQILWGRPIPMAEMIERINKITANRVKQIAIELLDKAKPTISALGPVGSLVDYQTIKKYFSK